MRIYIYIYTPYSIITIIISSLTIIIIIIIIIAFVNTTSVIYVVAFVGQSLVGVALRIRPVCLFRVRVSECLTQANSKS